MSLIIIKIFMKFLIFPYVTELELSINKKYFFLTFKTKKCSTKGCGTFLIMYSSYIWATLDPAKLNTLCEDIQILYVR